MRAWHHKRSAPVEALLLGAVVLITTAVASLVFYVSVVRAARGLSAFTAGVNPASLRAPAAGPAAYHSVLRGPPGRVTPGGEPSVAHRWRVTRSNDPARTLCAGAADDGLVAEDSSGARAIEVPIEPALYARGQVLPAVPPRVLASCGEIVFGVPEGSLRYEEALVAPGAAVEVVGCRGAGGPDAPIVQCEDGAPSRVYVRAALPRARAQARGAIHSVALCAGAFALVCFVAGVLVLRSFDRWRARAS